MNYSKIYDDLINRAIPRGLNKSKVTGYHEKHHILPKCLGGKDESANYVLLTFKEHVLAHRLLNLMYPHTKGLTMALTRMLMQIVDDGTGKKIKKKLTVKGC